jgi:uncharacterized protein YjbK
MTAKFRISSVEKEETDTPSQNCHIKNEKQSQFAHEFDRAFSYHSCYKKGKGVQNILAGKNEIFQRIEKKYLLTVENYQKLRERLFDFVEEDEYGLSTICNVYYDTQDYALIRDSIEKPVYKEKLRLRSYGTPQEQDKVFLELKKKYDGVVYKRRVSMPLKEARNYLTHGIRPDSPVNEQILKEIDYFKQFYEVMPRMYLAYDRIATYGKEDKSLRITFDQNIRYRQDDIELELGSAGHLLLKLGEVVMEIKVGGAYPLWLTEILSEMKIYPTSFSKYGNVYKKILTEERMRGELVTCLPA